MDKGLKEDEGAATKKGFESAEDRRLSCKKVKDQIKQRRGEEEIIRRKYLPTVVPTLVRFSLFHVSHLFFLPLLLLEVSPDPQRDE